MLFDSIQVEHPWDLARDSGQRSIGKIRYQYDIVRNFQCRKFLSASKMHILCRITAHPRGAFISIGDL